MKIHSYNSSSPPPHEEVNTRTVNSTRRKTQQQQQQQQANGVDSSERRRQVQQQQQQQQRQQQKPTRTARNNSSAAKNPNQSEAGSIGSRLALRRTQRQVQREETPADDGGDQEEEEEEQTAVKETAVVVVKREKDGHDNEDAADDDDDNDDNDDNNDDNDDDGAGEEEEEEDEELAPSAAKRPRREQARQQEQVAVAAVAAAAAAVAGTASSRVTAARPVLKVTPRRIKQEGRESVDEQEEHEPDEASLEFLHLPAGDSGRQLLLRTRKAGEGRAVVAEDDEQEVEEEEEEEDDGTSSSTASAEEEIGFEMDPQPHQQLQQKGGSRTTAIASGGGGRVQVVRGTGATGGRATAGTTTTTTILMTEEDYEQHQQEQEQQEQQHHHHQHGDEEDVAMDEYEGAMAGAAAAAGGSEEMEDTDGALTGNRLFRKKVKRKVHVRTNSTSAAGAGLGLVVGSTTGIPSAKGKLQMLQEFPTLFLGLRRNRMFLVNALAQSFDLNQRDIVLTLRKIKQNESSARLANFFGIGAAEVDLLFHTSVPKIADCLRNFIVWPDDFTMKLNVPVSLRQHFNRIHLILNYLVLRVKQNAVQQLPAGEVGLAYCPEDQCHKLKYLVASTLDGCVCFVSRAFGVQTDDEQLLAQSGFLTKFKTNTNLIAGQNFHNFEDRLANGHDHTNNNGGGAGGRNRRARGGADNDDSDLERVLGNCDEDNFEDIVSEKISKSRTFKLKNYIENILENFQNHQMLSPHTCIDGRTFKLLDDIVVIVGALINLQKQEIE